MAGNDGQPHAKARRSNPLQKYKSDRPHGTHVKADPRNGDLCLSSFVHKS